MHQTVPLADLSMDCENAVVQLSRQLSDYGLQVMRSFDLQTTRSANTHCTCQQYGTPLCDCQLVVLLVYSHPSRLGTLVAHGSNGHTQVSLVHSPQRGRDAALKNSILQALSSFDAPKFKIWMDQPLAVNGITR